MNEPAAIQPRGVAWLPLLLAGGLTLGLTIYPQFVVDSAGQADHRAALALMVAISSGFVRGVGFVPLHPLPRWIFSTPVCLLATALAAAQLLLHR